jgi:hypothetical protein
LCVTLDSSHDHHLRVEDGRSYSLESAWPQFC